MADSIPAGSGDVLAYWGRLTRAARQDFRTAVGHGFLAGAIAADRHAEWASALLRDAPAPERTARLLADLGPVSNATDVRDILTGFATFLQRFTSDPGAGGAWAFLGGLTVDAAWRDTFLDALPADARRLPGLSVESLVRTFPLRQTEG